MRPAKKPSEPEAVSVAKITTIGAIIVAIIGLVGTIVAANINGGFLLRSVTLNTPTSVPTSVLSPTNSPTVSLTTPTSLPTSGIAYPSYLPGHGTLIFSDALSSYNQAHGWSTDPNGCNFKDGAYYVTSANYDWTCGEYAQSFTNFVFEVHMKLLQGTTGMCIFRADSQFANYYTVAINSSNGSYAFYKYVNNVQNPLKVGYNSAILNNPNGFYTIDIVANGSAVAFYLNQQRIDSMMDTDYTQGNIGFHVTGNGAGIADTGAVFTNAEVWSL